MTMKLVKTFGLGIIIASSLAACGGGGSSESTTTVGTMSNTITIPTSTFMAGQSFIVTAKTTMRGAKPTAMTWTATSLSSIVDAHSNLILSNDKCESATITSPPFSDSSGVGVCELRVSIPPAAREGKWRLSNTATGPNGSVNGVIDINVISLPKSGFKVVESSLPISGYAGRAINLSAPFTANVGSVISNVKYLWTASATNSGLSSISGSSNAVASAIPVTAGLYQYDIKVTADVNGYPEEVTGSVLANIYPPAVVDIIDAGAVQVTVPGKVVNLTGSIANKDAAYTYSSKWTQLSGTDGGPARVNISNSLMPVSNFVVPNVPGTYGFEYLVRKYQVDGTETVTRATTSVIVQTDLASMFIASSGGAQIADPGVPVILTGRVIYQGSMENTLFKYKWTQIGNSPTAVTISDSTMNAATFISNVAGIYDFDFAITVISASGEITVHSQTQVVIGSSSFTVSAGDAQIGNVGAPVVLKGTVTETGSAKGKFSYLWSQVGSTPESVALSNSNSDTASFIPTKNGTYKFNLTVTDTTSGLSKISMTQIEVGGSSGATGSFSMSAGAQQNGVVNTSSTLTGTVTPDTGSSFDSYVYTWTQVGATPSAIVIYNANSLTANFTPTTAGVYTFTLTIDGMSKGVKTTKTAQTQVVVTGGTDSFTVSAGALQNGTVKTTATLTGIVTTNPSSTHVYKWTQVGTTPETTVIYNANSLVANFTPTLPGTYIFMLSVDEIYNGVKVTKTAQTQVIVAGSAGTGSFTVSAGALQNANVGTSTSLRGDVVLDSGVTATTTKYTWTQVGTTPSSVVIYNASTINANFTPLTAGKYIFMLTVEIVSNGVTLTKSAQTEVIAEGAYSFDVMPGSAQVIKKDVAAKLTGDISTTGDFTGATYQYLWTQNGATPAVVILTNATAKIASFVPSVVGDYFFTFSVTVVKSGVTTTKTGTTQITVIP